MTTDTLTHWHGCYDDSWKGTITEEAFAHPAKFSKGLIERIADHLALPRGAVVVDPFGGVGLGGIVFASRGVQWIGCELEEKFVKLAEQNFELHRRTWEGFGDPLPVIVQGDSRRLREHVSGVLADCVVSSPPYVSGTVGDCNTEGEHKRLQEKLARGELSGRESIRVAKKQINANSNLRMQDYGQTPGQLGNMKPGEVDAVVSSPPFAETEPYQDKSFRLNDGRKALPQGQDGYGTTPGQLGNMKPGEVDAVVSSPPYVETSVVTEQGQSTEYAKTRNDADRSGKDLSGDAGYGQTPGQLGNMKPGEVDAVVSSPPYEGSLANNGQHGIVSPDRDRRLEPSNAGAESYGDTEGNIGNQTGDTFWAAARDIVAECHAILKPGGLAVWVCKDFVRKGQRVPFSDDWERLCVSCGFESVERIHAQLVKRDSHPSLFGGEETTTKERKSFFRRLAESKGSPAIDHEDVIVMRKK